MAKLIVIDRGDGRTIASLMTSLLYNWRRLPPSLQAAIVEHACEVGFAEEPPSGADQIIAFIDKHHAAIWQDALMQMSIRRGHATALQRRQQNRDRAARRRENLLALVDWRQWHDKFQNLRWAHARKLLQACARAPSDCYRCGARWMPDMKHLATNGPLRLASRLRHHW